MPQDNPYEECGMREAFRDLVKSQGTVIEPSQWPAALFSPPGLVQTVWKWNNVYWFDLKPYGFYGAADDLDQAHQVIDHEWMSDVPPHYIDENFEELIKRPDITHYSGIEPININGQMYTKKDGQLVRCEDDDEDDQEPKG